MFKLNYLTTYSFYKINYNNLLLINLKLFNFYNIFFLYYYINLNSNFIHNLVKYKQIWKKSSQIITQFNINLFKSFPNSRNLNLNYYINNLNSSINFFNFNLKIIKNNKNYFYTFFKLNINLFKFYYLNYLIINFFKNIYNNFSLSYTLFNPQTKSLKTFNIFSSSKNILMINNFLI